MFGELYLLERLDQILEVRMTPTGTMLAGKNFSYFLVIFSAEPAP